MLTYQVQVTPLFAKLTMKKTPALFGQICSDDKASTKLNKKFMILQVGCNDFSTKCHTTPRLLLPTAHSLKKEHVKNSTDLSNFKPMLF